MTFTTRSILAPAIWLQRGIGLKRILLTTLLVGIGAAVVMDGSRSVWLASWAFRWSRSSRGCSSL